jgi:hypothetical protein
MARGRGTIARKAAGPSYWLVLGVIVFVGMTAVIKIEATETRLVLVVVLGVALGAASLVEHLLRNYAPTDLQLKGQPTDTSALGSTALMQITRRAQAQTAQGGTETPITEQEAHAIGVDAYLYFYPLVTMDVTRKVFTNVEPGKEYGRGPMNTFQSMPAYPAASNKGVVRYNFDTLYSAAWLDMTKEPMIVSVPDTNGRYYLLPMLDMWTDVFASPGWRTTGTQAGNFLITPPG